MPSSKNIVFDVIGTLVGYDNLYKAIENRLGERLKQYNVKSDMFGFMWASLISRSFVSIVRQTVY